KVKDQISKLTEHLKQVQNALSDLEIERQAGPVEQAMQALQLGAPGIAISKLEEADQSHLQPTNVKPPLLDLYCDTGQPDKALEMLTSGNADERTLGGDPGVAAM